MSALFLQMPEAARLHRSERGAGAIGAARLLWIDAAGAAPSSDARLAALGWAVQRVLGASEALRAPLPDACVVSFRLEDGDPLELVAELGRRAGSLPFVLVGSGIDASQCRRGFLAGARDVLETPADPLRIHAALLPRTERGPAPGREVQLHEEAVAAAVRQALAAWTQLGFGPCTRARAATVLHELLDNARRHAFADEGGHAWLELTEVHGGFELAVCDAGVGFAAEEARLAARTKREGVPSGLGLVEALCDRFDLSSSTGTGTRACCTFLDRPAEWSAVKETGYGRELDLSDHDHLPPQLLRRLLRRAHSEHDGTWAHLPAALAMTLGRALAGPLDPTRAHGALWRD